MPKIAKLRHLLQCLQLTLDYDAHQLTALELQNRTVFHAAVGVPCTNETMDPDGELAQKQFTTHSDIENTTEKPMWRPEASGLMWQGNVTSQGLNLSQTVQCVFSPETKLINMNPL